MYVCVSLMRARIFLVARCSGPNHCNVSAYTGPVALANIAEFFAADVYTYLDTYV